METNRVRCLCVYMRIKHWMIACHIFVSFFLGDCSCLPDRLCVNHNQVFFLALRAFVYAADGCGTYLHVCKICKFIDSRFQELFFAFNLNANSENPEINSNFGWMCVVWVCCDDAFIWIINGKNHSFNSILLFCCINVKPMTLKLIYLAEVFSVD